MLIEIGAQLSTENRKFLQNFPGSPKARKRQQIKGEMYSFSNCNCELYTNKIINLCEYTNKIVNL